MIFTSCDPDVTGEGISLPAINFKILVVPDTSYFQVGDTFTLFSSFKNDLEGVKLTDGKGVVAFWISRFEEIPITESTEGEGGVNGVDYILIEDYGRAEFTTSNKVNKYSIRIDSDSLRIKMRIKLLKTGVYSFYFAPSFYEGSKGKGRVDGEFHVLDPHWFFLQNGNTNPEPNSPHYFQTYFIAVTE